jgi:hypothetical protein
LTAEESLVLANAVQLTSRDRFIKAGEAYFNADATWIIFQATESPEYQRATASSNSSPPTPSSPSDATPPSEPDPFYAMFVARLVRNDQGLITGLDSITQISPPNSANTCGWFHPDSLSVIYGTTLTRPSNDNAPGFQVGTRRYVWQFPTEMDIVRQTLFSRSPHGTLQLLPELPAPTPLFATPHYDAECSLTSDGTTLLLASIRPPSTNPSLDPATGQPLPTKPDADLFLHDLTTNETTPLITADGYDGGPFFSPDNRWITYRSDRKGNDRLQIFVAELLHETRPNNSSVPIGVKAEHQLTANDHVNWAPYWHPSQRFVVYASSEAGHTNYEIYAVPTPLAKLRMGLDTTTLTPVRVTFAAGADVLPVFSPDASLFMWTSQRGPKSPGEQRPSSQLWIANWIADPAGIPPANP